MMNILSVDVEDWYTSGRIKEYINSNQVIPRIDSTIKTVLDVFDSNNVKATFFVLGEIALKHPDLVKLIYAKGHEIASHSMSHIHLWNYTPAEFKNQLAESNKILEDLTGQKVLGFRAPFASLVEKTAWLIDVLEELEFKYDSSIFPMKTPLYGVDNIPLSKYKIKSDNIKTHSDDGIIIEIPFTIYKKGLLKIPCTGAIYGRMIPFKLFNYLLQNIEKTRSLNFYFHPWEIDKEIPKVDLPFYNKFFAYYNTDIYQERIDAILKTYSFTTFSNYLNLE